MINTKLISTIAIAFLAGSIVTSFTSSTAAAVSPFDELRAAILHLQDEINHIQLIPGPPGPAGPASTVPGPQGPAGADGAQGPPGPAGATTNFYLLERNFPIAPNSEFQFPPLSVQCSPGDKIISGGYDNNPLQLTITGSFPNSLSSPQEWDVRGTNPSNSPSLITVVAVCAH